MDYQKYWIINFLPVDIDVIFLIKFTYINIKTFNALKSEQLMILSKQGYIKYNDVIYKCANKLIYDKNITYKGVRIYYRGNNIQDIYFHYLVNGKIYHVYIDFKYNMNPKNIKILNKDVLTCKRNIYTSKHDITFYF